MTLQLGRAISDGIDRVLTPTGGILLAVFLSFQLLTQASVNTAIVSLFPDGPAGEMEAALGLTLPVSGTTAGALFVGTVVLSSAFFVVLSRALTRPTAALSSFPSDLYTRRMGRPTLSMFVGGLVIGTAIIIGSVFLLLPGIFLAVSLLFFTFAIGVENRGILGGIKRSWGLSRGNRLKLAAVVLIAGIIGFVGGLVGTVFDFANSATAGELVVNTLNSIVFVLLYGVIASAYLQLRDENSQNADKRGGSDSLDTIGG